MSARSAMKNCWWRTQRLFSSIPWRSTEPGRRAVMPQQETRAGACSLFALNCPAPATPPSVSSPLNFRIACLTEQLQFRLKTGYCASRASTAHQALNRLPANANRSSNSRNLAFGGSHNRLCQYVKRAIGNLCA